MSGPRWPLVVGFVNCAAICFAAAGILVAEPGPPDAVQPIAFNHLKHIEEAEVECEYCHAGLSDPEENRIPDLELCTECHMDTLEDDPELHPELVKLAAHAEEERELDWVPLFRVPDHVYFPHVSHVEVGGLECTECHADMPLRTTPPEYLQTISMDACIACHEKYRDRPSAARATRDCASCHH